MIDPGGRWKSKNGPYKKDNMDGSIVGIVRWAPWNNSMLCWTDYWEIN